MQKGILIAVGIILTGAAIIVGIRVVSPHAAQPLENSRQNPVAPDSKTTLSDRRIQKAQSLIEKSPSKPDGYNLLSAAYMKMARETGDFGLNANAEAALNQSFKTAAAENNYDAVKLKAMLLLAYHRFDEALETARSAQTMQPNDPHNYGAMTDAHIELGNYDEAFESARKMMDIRPGTSSYTRVSYLRELQGDVKGAIQAMQAAAEAAPDPETLAWCRVYLGDMLINTGNIAAADHEFDIALYHFPDYHLALAGKARAAIASGNTTAAIEFYKQSQKRVPLPETAIALGDLYGKAGQADEAKKQYDLLEFIERANTPVGETYSRQLALFYADHDIKLDEALVIAQRERAARSDIYTCDALAWSLYKNGRFAEAKKSIEEALRLGTRDARINYHAGMIEQALGNRRAAVKHLQLALEINPLFDILQSDAAKETLRAMTATRQNAG